MRSLSFLPLCPQPSAEPSVIYEAREEFLSIAPGKEQFSCSTSEMSTFLGTDIEVLEPSTLSEQYGKVCGVLDELQTAPTPAVRRKESLFPSF